MSGFMASRLRAVSRSVSPFTRLDVEVEKFRESAERRFSASSNDDRFLVDRLDVTQSVANTKSFRILEDDVQTGCRKPTVYSLRKLR